MQYNEFFQYYDAENKIGGYDKGTYLKRSNENVSVAKHLSEQIIGEYNDGKETATILCSIADYFSDGGSISISTKTQKMSFNIGDKTIPMVYGFDGQDHPMSNYMDGTPKVFRVVGLKFIYDGAVWQELTLQEV